MKLRFLPFAKFIIGALCLCTFVSCDNDDDDDDDNTLTLSAPAGVNGTQEVPVVSTPGTGTLTGSYNKTTKELSYEVTWSNLKDSATLAHFHGPAPVGQNAGVLVTIFTTRRGPSGSISGTATLPDTTLAHFQNGLMYLNIHSKVHGGGEIRGQVALQ